MYEYKRRMRPGWLRGWCCVRLRAGRERGCPWDLLSDHIVIVAGLDLESAVEGPQVDGDGDARDGAFVYLDEIRVSTTSVSVVFCLVSTRTISAASVPAMANSRSAYFFQYPKKSG
jgi:hypothetical protein